MEYLKKEIKKGMQLHTIHTPKFKTNLMAVFLTTKLNRENVTKNAMLSAILRRGSKNMPSQEEISKEMEDMYGAAFDCGLDKIGDNQVLKFYVETINDEFIPQKNADILNRGFDKLLEIVFAPYIEQDGFKEEYVEQEKNNIRNRIESRIDNKGRYAYERCIEEMYKEEPFGLYSLGYTEDLAKIDGKNLYAYYQAFIQTCKIDIFVSGLIDEDITNQLASNTFLNELKEREPDFILPEALNKKLQENENIVNESMNIAQGKLLIGLDIQIQNQDEKYVALLYNSLLGGSANSKMFQNVREKEHLAYVANSSYLRHKSNVIINTGIEIDNYEKALQVIREQIEEMKKGDFSDEDLENCKKGIIATIQTIDDEQDTGITYYFGQALSQNQVTIEEYIKIIEKISKEEIVEIANKVGINTIYFLRN